MLKNRRLHLKEYQAKLLNRKYNLAFIMSNKETKELVMYRPIIKSMWLNKFAWAYGRERQEKLKEKFTNEKCRMITLTYDTKLYTPEQVARRHKADFKKFVRLIRKDYPDFEYAYFVEVTQKLYVHFHIYTNIFVKYADIKKNWLKTTGSYIVEVHLIKGTKRIDYTSAYHQVQTKYAYYQLQFAWKNIDRFFGQSRNFFKKEEDKEKIFEYLGFVKFRGHEVLQELEQCKKNGAVIITEDVLAETLHWLNLSILMNKQEKCFYLVDNIAHYEKEKIPDETLSRIKKPKYDYQPTIEEW